MVKKATATFSVPGQLGALLNAGHLRAQLQVTRADGAALDVDDLADVRATLEAWATRERRILEVIRRAARLVPASEAPPSKKILAAVAAAGGLRAPSKPRARGPAKRTRAPAKRA